MVKRVKIWRQLLRFGACWRRPKIPHRWDAVRWCPFAREVKVIGFGLLFLQSMTLHASVFFVGWRGEHREIPHAPCARSGVSLLHALRLCVAWRWMCRTFACRGCSKVEWRCVTCLGFTMWGVRCRAKVYSALSRHPLACSFCMPQVCVCMQMLWTSAKVYSALSTTLNA